MRKAILLGVVSCWFLTLTAQEALLPLFTDYFTGEWDNFQQAWQGNTDTDRHRVETDAPHRHLHVVIAADTAAPHWNIAYYETDDRSKLLSQQTMTLTESSNKGLQTVFYGADKKVLHQIVWTYANEVFTGQEKDSDAIYRLQKDRLDILDNDLCSNSANVPYRLLKCRFLQAGYSTRWMK